MRLLRTESLADGPIRVATYTRISTDEEHQPFSLEAQAERLGAYVRSQEGWELTRQFTDQMTGSTLERPGLQRALAEGRAKRFDLLLVYRVDRLSRSVPGLAQILEELDRAGVVFRSATEPFETGTAAGRMMVQMLGVFAEFERATLIDRVIAGMERKAARGGWNGGHCPFGYEVDPATGFLIQSDAEAALVPVMFDLYLNKRLGARSIAGWLNERGHRTRSGKLWSPITVLTVLRGRAYLGEVHFRGAHYPGPHPALIDTETFEGVQQLLQERGESHAKRATNSTDYLLSGLIVCGRCGSKYLGTAAHGRYARYRYYTCFRRHRYGTKACSAQRIPADELDIPVMGALLNILQMPTISDGAFETAIARRDASAPRDTDELAAITTEIRNAEDALGRYFRAFETGALPESLCSSRIKQLSELIPRLRARRADLQTKVEDGQSVIPAYNTITSLERALRRSSPARIRELLDAIGVTLQVSALGVIELQIASPNTTPTLAA